MQSGKAFSFSKGYAFSNGGTAFIC